MVQVGDDDFLSLPQNLADGQAHQTDKRRRIHAEGDLARLARVEEGGDTFAGALQGDIHSQAPGIAAATLNVVPHQMMLNRVQHNLRNLCAGSIIKEDELVARVQCWELLPDPLNGKS